MSDRLPHPDLTHLTATAAVLLAPHADIAPRSHQRLDHVRTLWERFADVHDVPCDPADADAMTMAMFTRARLASVRPVTASTDLWALTRLRAAAGQPPDDWLARAVIRGHREQDRPAPVVQATVLPWWFFCEMATVIRPGEPGYHRNDRWRAARDRALLGLGYGAALRPASLEDLDVDQLVRERGRLGVRLWTSKGNQPNRHGWHDQTVWLDPLPGAADPVALLEQWLDVRGDAPGALFPAYPDDIDCSILSRTIRHRLRKVGETAGAPAGTFTLYSLRRSWATHARLAGHDLAHIRHHLLHATEGVTRRYIAELEAHVANGQASHAYLSPVRPAGADYRFGTAVTRIFGSSWVPPDDGFDELRAATVATADDGLTGRAHSTRTMARQAGARWTRHCRTHEIDPHRPTETQVRDYALAEHGRGLRAVTVHRYMLSLTGWFLQAEPCAVPPTRAAMATVDGLLRREGRAPVTQAPIPRDGETAVAELVSAATYDDHDLCIAVLRWHAARQGQPLIRPGRLAPGKRPPWKQLTTDTVTVGPDWVDLALDDRTVRLHAEPDGPDVCPVRAATSLLDRPRHPDRLLDHISFGGNGTELRRSCGLSGRVESWTRSEFLTGTAWLAAELRRERRDRMLVAVLYAGALRGVDLRGAHIEDLERHSAGYLLYLRDSKHNRRGTPEAVALIERTDILDPVCVIDDFLAVWPYTNGPLLPGRCGDRSLHGDPQPMARSTMCGVIDRLGTSAGHDVTSHTFRRLAATLTWQDTGDLRAVQRRLRHHDLRHTRRYVEALTPRTIAAGQRQLTTVAG